MNKLLKIILPTFLLVLIAVFCFFFVGKAVPVEKINWGVVFSQKHAQLLGLDWQTSYLAVLDDLGVKKLKLIAYWDLIEKQSGILDFADLDWQINEAQQRGAKVLLVMGRRVPRWPECHFPDWAKSLGEKEQQQKILDLIKEIVLRYKDAPAIEFWQVENEPFFPFGECPPPDEEFLKQEIALVKSLDTHKRQVIITESGEFPLWFKAARLGDIVGHTLYKKVWIHQLKTYLYYPFPPIYYARKAWLVNKIFGKKVICVELQAEPWGPVLLYDLPLSEHDKTMNPARFKKIIEFAKNTGYDTFYLWGTEWWYWQKEKVGDSRIWDEAIKIFNQ